MPGAWSGTPLAHPEIDLAAAKPTKELIQTFQREAERIEAERQKPKPPEEQPQYRMRMR